MVLTVVYSDMVHWYAVIIYNPIAMLDKVPHHATSIFSTSGHRTAWKIDAGGSEDCGEDGLATGTTPADSHPHAGANMSSGVYEV